MFYLSTMFLILLPTWISFVVEQVDRGDHSESLLLLINLDKWLLGRVCLRSPAGLSDFLPTLHPFDIWYSIKRNSRHPPVCPSPLFFGDFIAMVCFHFAANLSITPSVPYFLLKRSSSLIPTAGGGKTPRNFN